MPNTLPIPVPGLDAVWARPDTLTVIYGNERVTLDPSKPWPEVQAARLRAETLIDQAIDAHDAIHGGSDAFEFAGEVYEDAKS